MRHKSKQPATSVSTLRAVQRDPAAALLSHCASTAVPSPKLGLTSVFGMGTGVAPAQWAAGKTAFSMSASALQINTNRCDNRIIFLGLKIVERVQESQASRTISTGQLHTLLCFHLQPIKLLVLESSLGDRSLREISS